MSTDLTYPHPFLDKERILISNIENEMNLLEKQIWHHFIRHLPSTLLSDSYNIIKVE